MRRPVSAWKPPRFNGSTASPQLAQPAGTVSARAGVFRLRARIAVTKLFVFPSRSMRV
jgi:hypothetical protein